MTIYEALEKFQEEKQRCIREGDEQMAAAYENAIKSLEECIKEREHEL